MPGVSPSASSGRLKASEKWLAIDAAGHTGDLRHAPLGRPRFPAPLPVHASALLLTFITLSLTSSEAACVHVCL